MLTGALGEENPSHRELFTHLGKCDSSLILMLLLPLTFSFARQEHIYISIQDTCLLIAAHQFLIRLTYIDDM